jgi:uncharacterized membrane protein HdeD (DUF308 family)
MARNWWLFALRGVSAVIFGVLALLWPGVTLLVLVLFIGAYLLLDGLLTGVGALRHRDSNRRGWLVLLGSLASIVIGIVTFVWPGLTAVALLYLVTAWAVITGVLEITAAVQLRKDIANEWVLGLAGLASIALGVVLYLWPGAGLLSLVWLVGSYAILFGVLLIMLGFRLRDRSAFVSTAA